MFSLCFSKFSVIRYCYDKIIKWKKKDINLVPLMPDEDKIFSGSLVLDLRIL